MARLNDAIFVPGRSCPACGSALRWLPGRTRINVPSDTRDSFYARPERRVVSRSGREAETRVTWVTTADAICLECNRIMDSRDGREGYEPGLGEAPRGYWLPDAGGVSGGCQPEGPVAGVAPTADPQATPQSGTPAEGQSGT